MATGSVVGLREVAARAGVSLGTASNALAGRRPVAAATREAVFAAAAALGYRPPARRHPVLGGAVETVGLLFRHGLPLATNPFYSHVFHGAQAACAQFGIGLTHEAMTDPRRPPLRLPVMVEQRRVQGVLVVGYLEPSVLALLAAGPLPFVMVDHAVDPPPSDVVRGADEDGGYLATRHLIDRGHRAPPPALIVGSPAHASFRDRHAGYRRALAEAGLPWDDTYERIDVDGEGAVAAAVDALLALPRPPTALFCANDQFAMEAMTALRRHGRRVPEEVSIVGYDDLAWAAHAAPPLTTVRVDKELLGAQGLRMLLERIEFPEMPPRQTRIAVSLRERASVAPPPG